MASKRRTAFVPRVVLSTVFLGVVPACVTACSSDDSSTGPTVSQGVAADAFGVGVAFVADSGFVALADIGFTDTNTDAPDDGGDAGDAISDGKTDAPESG